MNDSLCCLEDCWWPFLVGLKRNKTKEEKGNIWWVLAVCKTLWFVCEKWKSLSRVQLFETLWTIQSMEFSRTEYWSGYAFSSRSSWPRNQTRVSCIAGGFFTSWATREALSSHRHAQLLPQFLAPCLSGKLGETAENSKLLIMDWSFWLRVPTQSRLPEPT